MKDMRKKSNVSSLQRGFSFVEMMVVVAIMTIVIAVLTDGMIQIQDKSANDVSKVGAAQESRQFMDQILRDLRQCGFPSPAMFDPATAALYPNNIANGNGTNTNGLINFSSSAIQFEGDIDGSGVSEIYIQAVPATGNCPCIV